MECSVDSNVLINKIKILKDYPPNKLESKSPEYIQKLWDSKCIQELLTKKNCYENELHELDDIRFSKSIIETYSFAKTKELYKLYILGKSKRISYIQKIEEMSNLTKERLQKWSTERLRSKYDKISEQQKKQIVIENLISWGDGISLPSTPTNILNQRNNYLKVYGSTISSEKRLSLTKKLSRILRKHNVRIQYKKFMTMNTDDLEKLYIDSFKKYHRKDLIQYLIEHGGYTPTVLRNKKAYVLEYLKSDLQPKEKGSRAELIRILTSKNIKSRNTLRNWDMDRLKKTYKNYLRDSYSPLSECDTDNNDRPIHPRLNRSRLEYLEDLNNLLIYSLEKF